MILVCHLACRAASQIWYGVSCTTEGPIAQASSVFVGHGFSLTNELNEAALIGNLFEWVVIISFRHRLR